MPTRPQRVQGTVTQNRPASPQVTHLTVQASGLPPFAAGQFAWLTIKQESKLLKRPYSMASAPWEQDLQFCIEHVKEGEVSPHLAQLLTGSQIEVFSPLGVFTLPQEEQDLLFICTGTGIAPFRSMLRTLFQKHFGGEGTDTSKQVTLLFGTRTSKEILYQDEFTKLQKEKENFNYFITLSREEAEGMGKGHVQDQLDQLDLTKASIFICGLTAMVIDVKKALLERGVPESRIHTELYN